MFAYESLILDIDSEAARLLMLFVGMRATWAATLIPQVLPAAFSEAVYQAAVLDVV